MTTFSFGPDCRLEKVDANPVHRDGPEQVAVACDGKVEFLQGPETLHAEQTVSAQSNVTTPVIDPGSPSGSA